MPRLELSPGDVERVSHGQAVEADGMPDGTVLAYDADGSLVAVMEADPEAGVWRPRKVFVAS